MTSEAQAARAENVKLNPKLQRNQGYESAIIILSTASYGSGVIDHPLGGVA